MSTEEHVLLCVREGCRVALSNRTYEQGETFTVPAESVDQWLSRWPVDLADESPVTQSSDSVPTMRRRTKENTFDHWFDRY